MVVAFGERRRGDCFTDTPASPQLKDCMQAVNKQAKSAPSSRETGHVGEEMAVDYLLSAGYTIISRNFQSKKGEIDCIAKDPKGTLAFIEVKYAKTSSLGHPARWVTWGKQKKIIAMARRYLGEHNLSNQACRFDVIAIVNTKIEHIKNAFLS
jgi:putative endonuclease